MCLGTMKTSLEKWNFACWMQFESVHRPKLGRIVLFSDLSATAQEFGNNSFWGQPSFDRQGLPWDWGNCSFPGSKVEVEKGVRALVLMQHPNCSQPCTSPSMFVLPCAKAFNLFPFKCLEQISINKTHTIIQISLSSVWHIKKEREDPNINWESR